MLKYTKFVKHAIIPKMYILDATYKLFPVYSLLNKLSTFFTPMQLHTLKKIYKGIQIRPLVIILLII